MPLTSFINELVSSQAGPLMVAIVVVILLVVVLAMQIRNGERMRNLTYPVYDYTVKKAEQEAAGTLEDARKEARSIIAEAERAASHIIEERKQASANLAATYEEELKDIAKQHGELVRRYASSAEEAYKGLEKMVNEYVTASNKAIKAEAETLADNLKGERKGLREEIGKRIASELEAEMKAARDSVDAYRNAQKQLLDKKLISLVEYVASIALQKELNLKDHTEQIYKALEAAKKDGIF